MLGDVERQAGDGVDVAVQARGQLRSVHRKRDGLVRLAGRVQVPLRAEQLLRVLDADRRADAQVRHVDGRRDAVVLERADDRVASRRRRAVLVLQRRQRQILAVGRRRRVARCLHGVRDALLVGDHPQLERELQPRRRRPQVLQALVRDVSEVDLRRRGDGCTRRSVQRQYGYDHRGEVSSAANHGITSSPPRGLDIIRIG